MFFGESLWSRPPSQTYEVRGGRTWRLKKGISVQGGIVKEGGIVMKEKPPSLPYILRVGQAWFPDVKKKHLDPLRAKKCNPRPCSNHVPPGQRSAKKKRFWEQLFTYVTPMCD